MTPERRACLVRSLAGYGADAVSHEGSTLLAHLVGTADLLHAWGARDALCEAGLFHSIYGTESFGTALVRASDRGPLQALLGLEAERIAWAFGAVAKESFYARLAGPDALVRDRFTGDAIPLDAALHRDLCDLWVANWLEQRPRAPVELQYVRAAEFQRMLPNLLPRAAEALAAAYGF
jgi:hypothetical protein